MKDMQSNENSASAATPGSSFAESSIANINNNATVFANVTSMSIRHSSAETSTYLQSIPLSLLQWIIFLLGTAGNVFVLFVLLWRRSAAHLVTQLFIGSMCVANIGMMCGMAWIQAMLYIDEEWKFGLVSCKMYFFLSGLTIGCSTWTLAAIAADR